LFPSVWYQASLLLRCTCVTYPWIRNRGVWILNLVISFAGLKGLDSLVLGHNRLKEVPARAFSHLTYLNSLELDGNQITHIHPEAFFGLEGWYNQLLVLAAQSCRAAVRFHWTRNTYPASLQLRR
jgi:hypothetical protein